MSGTSSVFEPPAGCPPDETIAAFLDGRLAPSEYDDVKRHLDQCERCRQLLLSVGEQLADEDGRRGRVIGMGRAWRWTSVLAAAAAVLVTTWIALQVRNRQSRTGLEDLVAAVGTQRLFEPRLSGGFAYGESSVQRGPAGPAVPPDVRIAVANIEKSVDPSDPRALARRGAARLVDGNVAGGAEDLGSAAAKVPGDARVLNDYAAALLLSADRDASRALSLRVQAFDAASRATRLDRGLGEAWFNRALAAERMPPASAAIAAWQDYLRVESNGGWAAEARRRLERLRAGSQSDGPLPVPGIRRRFEHDRVPEWARLEAGRADAGPARDRLLGDVRDLTATGDALAADTLRAIDRVPPGSAASSRLARAHIEFADAYRNYERDEFGRAERGFTAAGADLRESGSPFALSAQLYLATIAYQRGDMARAWQLLPPIATAARQRQYTSILVRVAWMEGLILANRGELVAAIGRYRAALLLAERLRDGEYEASVSGALADGLRTLGEREQSWAYMERALTRLESVTQPIRQHVLLLNAALFAEHDGQLEAALYFHDAALAAARARGGPGPVVDSLTYRAAVLNKIGRHDEAGGAIQEASTLLKEVPDGGLARFLSASLEQASAEIALASDPEAAIRHATAARAVFADVEPERVPRILLLRAQAGRAAGRPSSADQDLAEGIALFESYRARVGDQDLRISYFDAAWQLYAELADLQLSRGNPDGALQAAERGRTRSLADHASSTVPQAIADVTRFVPREAVALEYLVLERRTILWTITATTRAARTLPAGRRHIEQLTADALREIAEDRPPLAAEHLYELLIAPIAGELPAGAPLIVVADGPLCRLPFAALRDRAGGQYLIEQRPIAMAPSLGLLPASPRSATPPTRVLVVGNPAAAGVPALEFAARESAAIARMYPEATALAGAEATWPRVRGQWGRAEVVHIGAHASANDEYPGYSRLFLAPDAAGHDGVVFSRDLAALAPSRARLVVLAACRTDAGPLYNGEGVISLARPLLQAGVPAVIAAAWDVDDAATAALFEAFHRHLVREGSAIAALRTAQLALAHSDDSALARRRNWAGFRLIGLG